MKLEVYLDAISTDRKEKSGMPICFRSVEEIKKRTPQLVEQRFLIEVAQVEKKQLALQVPLKEMWEWQLQKENYETRVDKAKSILLDDGWEIDEETGVLTREKKDETQRLTFSILTSSTPELKAVAQMVTEAWKNIGVEADAKFFETSDLNQNVIRPRRYDALLFGEIVGRELDLFSFWHSSQRNDPGLNIALYANITADDILARARENANRTERENLYREFEKEIENDIPAIFLYSPLFIYIVPEKINGIELGPVTTTGERFLNIHKWYVETEYVWPFFTK